MGWIVSFLIAIAILLLGIPLGNLLAKFTHEELRGGRVWFQTIIIVSLVCGVFSLVVGNDYLLFSFLFMAIVTSRSLIA